MTDQRHAAMLQTAAHAHDPADCRHLLDVLGLLPEHTETAPDHDLDGYAAALVPLAARLAGAVRHEGLAATRHILDLARAIPAPAGVDPLEALAVVLAAMVDQDRTPGELLAWADPHPHPTGPGDPAAIADLVDAVCPPGRGYTDADTPHSLRPAPSPADAQPAADTVQPIAAGPHRPQEVA